jgi:hypothetical protein
VARNKYGIEKRQRELNKERKKEEKRQRKLERTTAQESSDAAVTPGQDESSEADPPTR